MGAPRAPGLVVLLLVSCSLDTEAPAPFVAQARAPGVCGTTATLLPALLEYARTGGFAPIAEVFETLSKSRGEISLRTLVQAAVRLFTGVGLDRTASAVRFESTHRALTELEPLLTTALRLVIGKIDGQPRWEAFEAIGTLVDKCEPNALLSAIEGLLRLEVGGQRWISLLAKDVSPLLTDPTLEPFLLTFERESERGKPAVVSLINQILGFITNDDFRVERVRTLLESAVYPLVSEALRLKIEALVVRMEQATDPDAKILVPLQKALSCLNGQPKARADLTGVLYDLITVDEVQLDTILMSLDGVVSEADSAQLLDYVADGAKVMREDPLVSKQILGAAEILLERPAIEEIAPMLLDMIEKHVGDEAVTAIGRLLEGCGR